MKVSIVVPVYNVEAYLGRCMDSLLSQSFADREIILVDDGSTDGSGALCERYAALPGIRVLHQENAGLGMARNSGMAVAQGEYLLFIDPDDYVGPDLLETLYAAAREQDADICIGGFTVVDVQGRAHPRPCVEQTQCFVGAALKELLLNTVGSLPEEALDSKYGVTACARLYRRRMIQEHALRFVSERELISEDLIFNLEFLKHTQRAVVTADAAYFYCTHMQSLSKRHRADRFDRDCTLYHAVEERLAEVLEEKEYRRYLQRMLISRARFDIAQEVRYHDQVERAYPLRQRLERILGSRMLQAALEDYPWQKLPKMQGIFAFAMKKKRAGLLIWLVRARQALLP